MFNKSIVQALAKQLEPLGNVVTSVLEGTPASSDAEKQVRKIVWTWTENLATLFWCLAYVKTRFRNIHMLIRKISIQ